MGGQAAASPFALLGCLGAPAFAAARSCCVAPGSALTPGRCGRPTGGGCVLCARYREAVARRARILAFGSAAGLVVVGVMCAILVGGLTGEVLAIALVSLGLVGAVLLVSLEAA